MKTLLKNAREAKGLKVRELAELSKTDQALISKFESGTRMPTKEQIRKFSEILDIDFQQLKIAWLKEKLIKEIGTDEFAIKAMRFLLNEIDPQSDSVAPGLDLENLLADLDALKAKLGGRR